MRLFVLPSPPDHRPGPAGSGSGSDDRRLVPLRGLDLRYASLLALSRRFGIERSLAELLDDLAALGVRPDSGRPGKALADALRWEVRRGRVARTGWGRYRLATLPSTTRGRARARLRAILEPPISRGPAPEFLTDPWTPRDWPVVARFPPDVANSLSPTGRDGNA